MRPGLAVRQASDVHVLGMLDLWISLSASEPTTRCLWTRGTRGTRGGKICRRKWSLPDSPGSNAASFSVKRVDKRIGSRQSRFLQKAIIHTVVEATGYGVPGSLESSGPQREARRIHETPRWYDAGPLTHIPPVAQQPFGPVLSLF